MEVTKIQTLSIVIPVFNEQDTLETLTRQIKANAAEVAEDCEIIFVDDGSTDGSVEILHKLAQTDPAVRLIRFGTNYGKASALDVGFKQARGEIIITMDADLQDDPSEIQHFVQKIQQGYDLVSGWKKVRHDPWHKTVPSKFFNFVVSRASGLRLHDFNCGFKAYRRHVVKHLSLYGELHRFIPVLAGGQGARVTEIPVKHNPRRFGQSKYGFGRLPKGFFDLLTVMVTTRYLKRPMHVFGSFGLASFSAGLLILAYMVFLWFDGFRPIGNRPLFLFGILS
jgi:glycosyltransferase involved in cell wall biosynthesis